MNCCLLYFMQSWRYFLSDTRSGILNLFLQFFFMALKYDDVLQNISVSEGAAVKVLWSNFELTLVINSTFSGAGSCSFYSYYVSLSLWRQWGTLAGRNASFCKSPQGWNALCKVMSCVSVNRRYREAQSYCRIAGIILTNNFSMIILKLCCSIVNDSAEVVGYLFYYPIIRNFTN